MEVTRDGDAPSPSGAPPIGWYPDPGGAARWRRWEGTTWGETTMPYGPAPPDGLTLAREHAAWKVLRAVAPWGLVAPAIGAACIASQSATFAALRTWFRPWLRATLAGTTPPPMPTTTVPSPALVTLVWYLVAILALIGVSGWIRFTMASMRTAALARYPSRHHDVATCLLFFLPIVGPLVAMSASKGCLPTGHEARRTLTIGWWCVLAGELTWVGVWVTVLSTPSLAAAWGAAALCGACWLVAAVQLPTGLEAVADDHAALGVQLEPAPS